MRNQAKKVTRIYQGRVSECEINGKKQLLSVLWEHHQLASSAVCEKLASNDDFEIVVR